MSTWCLLKALASIRVEFAGAGTNDSLLERDLRGEGWGS